MALMCQYLAKPCTPAHLELQVYEPMLAMFVLWKDVRKVQNTLQEDWNKQRLLSCYHNYWVSGRTHHKYVGCGSSHQVLTLAEECKLKSTLIGGRVLCPGYLQHALGCSD